MRKIMTSIVMLSLLLSCVLTFAEDFSEESKHAHQENNPLPGNFLDIPLENQYKKYLSQWQANKRQYFSQTNYQLASSRGFSVKPIAAKKIEQVQRVALLIGNSDYPVSPLENSSNDAVDLSAQLRNMGFHVTHLDNADRRTMQEAIRQFGELLRTKNTVGLFYYAGHGMQVNGKNYMIPIDASINVEHEIEYEAVDVGRVLAVMESAQNLMNLVVLDACRDNPFKRSFRSSAKGLAQMDAPTGTFIAYATAPGQVAQDGDGRNGIYTKHLLRHLIVPGLSVEEMFKRVRVGVMAETHKSQVPWESSSLIGVFYFVPSNQAPPAWMPPALIDMSPPPRRKENDPWYTRWYVWTVVAAVTGVALWKCGGGDGGSSGQGGKGGGCRW